MGTFSSSLMRIICSRSSDNSERLLWLVIEKTRRNPWPVFMYNSLLKVSASFNPRLKMLVPHGSCWKSVEYHVIMLEFTHWIVLFQLYPIWETHISTIIHKKKRSSHISNMHCRPCRDRKPQTFIKHHRKISIPQPWWYLHQPQSVSYTNPLS